MKRRQRWTEGNRFDLLENGEEFFPAVFAAIESAQREVILETFILFMDKVGWALHAALLAAARRGVHVDVTVDGFGSPDLSGEFIGELTAAGVNFHIFDPGPRLFGWRVKMLRRMHRKIVVVDGRMAFVGGINYSADHLADYGPEAKQDYSIRCEGPIVEEIHRFARSAIVPARRPYRWFHRLRRKEASAPQPRAGSAQSMFVTRDNIEHRNDIERHYRLAIRMARHEVIIANAYFFPGFRLLRELMKAAKRGVKVRLILQGEPDMQIVKIAAGMLYDHLINGGVRIYEYCDRPLHGKVALMDDEWSTVGSSNLDPLSLSLNLEANVIIRDRAFNQHLRERLRHLMEHSCKEITAEAASASAVARLAVSFVVFHFLRRFPAWAQWLPKHEPQITSMHPEADAAAEKAAPSLATAAGATRTVREGATVGGADRVTEQPGAAS